MNKQPTQNETSNNNPHAMTLHLYLSWQAVSRAHCGFVCAKRSAAKQNYLPSQGSRGFVATRFSAHKYANYAGYRHFWPVPSPPNWLSIIVYTFHFNNSY